MELYTLYELEEYTGIPAETLRSRSKTLGIKALHRKSYFVCYTTSQAGCLIGNYTYSNNNEFLILKSKL